VIPFNIPAKLQYYLKIIHIRLQTAYSTAILLVISVCLLLCLSIICQPKVQEMTDVERIEIDEIIKQLFLECE